MKIEDIFKEAENGTLTLEQFQQLVTDKGAKFADLSEGKYVSEAKHSSEIQSLEKQIETLTETIAQREADIEDVRQQLIDVGNDAARLEEVSQQLEALREQYDEDAAAYEEQLSNQAREFAVREYAATKEFTSSAAKKYYIEQMINSEDVRLNKKGDLIGMEDFDEEFGVENEGAFAVKVETPAPSESENNAQPLPRFTAPTPGAEKPASKMSLTEMMQAKNENPDMSVSF